MQRSGNQLHYSFLGGGLKRIVQVMMTRVSKSLEEKSKRGMFLYTKGMNNERKEHDINTLHRCFQGQGS